MNATTHVVAALAKACSEIPTVGKKGVNELCGSTYATLDGMLRVIKPILAKHGLWPSFSSQTQGRDFKVLLTVHHIDSGEHYGTEIAFTMETGGPHEVGSLMTYGRRYLLASMLCLELGVDDDGCLAESIQEDARDARKASADQAVAAASIPAAVTDPVVAPVANRDNIVSFPPPVAQPSQGMVQDALAQPATTMGNTLDPVRVQIGKRLTDIWGEATHRFGQARTDAALKEVAGTTYIKLIKPDQFQVVIAHFERMLAAS
jgi:hypothetical protein